MLPSSPGFDSSVTSPVILVNLIHHFTMNPEHVIIIANGKYLLVAIHLGYSN